MIFCHFILILHYSIPNFLSTKQRNWIWNNHYHLIQWYHLGKIFAIHWFYSYGIQITPPPWFFPRTKCHVSVFKLSGHYFHLVLCLEFMIIAYIMLQIMKLRAWLFSSDGCDREIVLLSEWLFHVCYSSLVSFLSPSEIRNSWSIEASNKVHIVLHICMCVCISYIQSCLYCWPHDECMARPGQKYLNLKHLLF